MRNLRKNVSNPFRAGGEALTRKTVGGTSKFVSVSNPFRAGGEALTATASGRASTAEKFQTPSERAVRRCVSALLLPEGR